MRKVMRHLDRGTLIVAVVTLVLFIVALIVKGLSHEILLEAGVFLISVKLLMMVYHHGVATEEIKAELAKTAALLERIEELVRSGRR